MSHLSLWTGSKWCRDHRVLRIGTMPHCLLNYPSPVSFAIISLALTRYLINMWKISLNWLNSQHRLPSEHLVLNLTSTAREKVAQWRSLGLEILRLIVLIVLYLLLGSIPSLSSHSDLNLLSSPQTPCFSILFLSVSNTYDIWHVLLFHSENRNFQFPATSSTIWPTREAQC